MASSMSYRELDEVQIAEAIGHLADQDPDEAFRIVSNQPTHRSRRLEEAIIARVARIDIDKAIDLLDRLSEKSLPHGAITIGRTLATISPERTIALENP